jgi:dolichyl-phosphate beta-glucosyltransferase
LGNFISSLSVVIPVYNGAAMILDTINDIQAYLNATGIDYEIIVADDGSTDGTDRVAAGRADVRLLRRDQNRGKGDAVRRGMLAAKHNWAVFTDVDNATTMDHLERFAPATTDHDVITASRKMAGAKIIQRQPFSRRLSGSAFRILVGALFSPGVGDTQCGFKLFRANAARDVFSRQTLDGFAFDVEILVIAKQLGFNITEIPIDWNNQDDTRVALGRHSSQMFKDLFRIKRQKWAGRYE